MEATKSLKKAILVSVLSAAASLLVTHLGKRMMGMANDKRELAKEDKKLTSALKDSMDCSDPVAKY